jgi:hypothetical protein
MSSSLLNHVQKEHKLLLWQHTKLKHPFSSNQPPHITKLSAKEEKKKKLKTLKVCQAEFNYQKVCTN